MDEGKAERARPGIHPSSIVHPDAGLGTDVQVGAFCVIGASRIGSRAELHPHVVIGDGVEIGEGTEIFPGAVVGKEPKGAGALARPLSFRKAIKIGAGCSIGPHAVIYYDVEIGSATLVGDRASIREQCRIGDQCIISRCVIVNYAVTIAWNERRRAIACTYLEALAGSGLVLPHVPDWAAPVWHLFVVRHPERDRLQQHLTAAGIGTLIHYPVPPHRQRAYAGAEFAEGAFPVASRMAAEALSLPMGPQLTSVEADAVVTAVTEACRAA